MRGQSSEASCGPTAMYNALRALDIERGLHECEKLCGTTMTDGTTTKKLVKALATIAELRPVPIRERRRDIAMMRLHEALLAGRPVILLVNSEQPEDHYVAVVGMLGSRYLIADSADHELVISRTPEDVSGWWGDAVTWGVVL